VRKECGLEATPGFKLGPDTNMDTIMWAVREFTHINSPSVVLFEFGPEGYGNREEAEDLVRQMIQEMKEDSILVVSGGPEGALEPVMDDLVQELTDTVISSLASPLMRDILKFVDRKGKVSFTGIQEELEVSPPSKLSYHIGNLKKARMLHQDSQGLYGVTGLGRMAVASLKRMEAGYVEEISLGR